MQLLRLVALARMCLRPFLMLSLLEQNVLDNSIFDPSTVGLALLGDDSTDTGQSIKIKENDQTRKKDVLNLTMHPHQKI